MPQFDILLCALNSRFIHSAFGLRYLYANLNELQERAKICEYTINQNTESIALDILRHKPKLIGFGVYIWNVKQLTELIRILKKVAPEVIIVVGGPEVSHESETQEICKIADYVIKGEGDFLFYEFCKRYFSNETNLPKFTSMQIPEIADIASPYPYYTQSDIDNRIIYVEASRGCPYKCEYCLSSLDKSVRNFNTDTFLLDMQMLLDKGVRQFKFIDRTFNLSPAISTKILRFFLDKIDLGLFLHFEMVPDRLPEELRELICQFPKGSLQFEIGVQTWNPQVASNVSRRQDYSKIIENFQFLSANTGVHTHADLIVGLPGESVESFAHGFDSLYKLQPDEIQVGILKKLKGAPISRHDIEYEMVYSEIAPFQILKNKHYTFEEMQAMSRFADFWDWYANSGNFKNTLKLFYEYSQKSDQSFFWNFYGFTEFLSSRHMQTHSIALVNLAESIWIYLKERMYISGELVQQAIVADYCIDGKRDLPRFLKEDYNTSVASLESQAQKLATPKRQQRHQS